jgi:hypothetical protein
MNEMYKMSVDIHLMGVVAMAVVIIGNILHVKMANDIHFFAKKMRQIMPIMSSLLFLILFTGVVMMAAKHLDFSIENIVMIIFNIVMIILEAKRYASLKHCNIKEENVFDKYKVKALKILTIELVGTLMISAWMLI